MRIPKEVTESSFRVATTIILCISMTFFVVILGMFVNDRVREFIISEDSYFPPLHPFSPFSPSPPASPSSLPPNSSTSNGGGGFGDWLAPKDLWHSMTEEELMWRASMVPQVAEFPYNRTQKVAFMFLTRGALPLAPLWEKFFKGHEGLFSIYLHTSPEFTGEPPETSVFYKRRVPSKRIYFYSKCNGENHRRLLANALLDFSNERFVLLSETCIPLFNFTTVYTYILGSNQSFLGSFDDPRPMGRGGYNKRMWPTISISDWRKGSQWFEAHRKLAIQIVSDVKYYPIFEANCRPPCYMDEHYLPTLVTKVCPELSSNRTVTWVDWAGGGSHPRMFVRKDVNEKFLDRVRYGFNFNCSYNAGVNSICFLFARKFHPSALQPLLQIAPSLLGFNP
ncbi:hypothetical protein NMG60_11018928 [Bertholletia excelsa]